MTPTRPATEYIEDRALEIAAMALHRWKHPTYRLGEEPWCSCRADARVARSLLDEDTVAEIRDD